ncbi:MAG TPA: LytTR family DNA-binding domain-containing protein [Chitinophagaceae bacterium]|nr:LytTR family DNA-binding domain-containing protein [Chitinophagaceae bacterium]
MKVLIIEDEKPAAEKLQKALLQANKDLEVLAVAGSTQSAIRWLQQNNMPDIIFMDIQLTDGLSFAILDQVRVSCPVIFTTAFDEYWQEAFEYNGIDYLLKPIKQEKLEAALQKFQHLKEFFTSNYQQLQQWRQEEQLQRYKKRFLVKRGMDYISVKTEEIAYFYAAHKLVCMVDSKGQKCILDKSLAELEKETDPAHFYRLNRKFLVSIQAIKKIKTYPKSKLLVELVPAVNEEIIVSQENVSAFKEWMGQ